MRRMIQMAMAAGLFAAAVGCSNCTHGVCDCEKPAPPCLHAEPAPFGVAPPALHAEPVPPPKVIIEK